ncbi:DUF192 domain-containing protein [Anaeromyxobacter diazotrophicus]|uniref:DUF192 domain-containing protein n=1 Tax=Anaeromyxobacter diazotrophicus TaxID=2590199 RepID=UPI001F17464E|nr:DUF192 domain-containing protein [Anaeromyxobacter diazotrophicus]
MGLALALAACRAPGPPAGRGADAASAPPRVLIESPSGRVSAVAVELARGEAQLARGLMFRERLGPDEGMLFVFPDTAVHAFWMKNTLIPLDMIFIDEGKTVVGIVERAEPHSTAPRTPGRPSRYVLEVNGGWSAAHGVAAGDRVTFEGDAARD